MEYIYNHRDTVQYFGLRDIWGFPGVQPLCFKSLLQTPQYCVDLCYHEGKLLWDIVFPTLEQMNH